ncbi:hypothetical protein KGM_204587 [Danaus plexippus plexippus]|uniref:Uncharacterized protein n=1 Tax=Danaus plexippus plexippus TaxID=278856 RepID=A0A212FAM5_DANPL|nr:hypothetical protein KGM_204587 [Danaus plexippus plexippus]
MNFVKSVLVLTQCLECQAISWNTKLNIKSLSEPKCIALRIALHHQNAQGSWSPEKAQSVLGRLNIASSVVLQKAIPLSDNAYHSQQLPVNHPYHQKILAELDVLKLH